MATIAVFVKIDEERIIDSLREACEKLDGAEGELVLDFSSVRRIDPGAVKTMEDLVISAESKAVKIILRGIGVDIYKVLKLVRLTQRLSFVN